MIPSRTAPDLIAGQWQLLGMGAAPRQLVWDNESAVGVGGAASDLTGEFEAFRGALGAGCTCAGRVTRRPRV